MTSNDAALSVPDWPLSWGRLVPPFEGGIRYEFAHRVLAAAVALLTGILAFRLQVREPNPWLRHLAWAAFATVMAQAALGGAMVKLVDPKSLAIAHACLAQLCFGLTAAVAVGLHPTAARTGGAGKGVVPSMAVVGMFVQTILGTGLRHGVIGLTPHIAGAALATALVMWASMGVLIHHMDEAALRRPAMALLMLTALQIFLGVAAYAARQATADDPQPMPLMVWATVAHVVVGALAFGAAIALAIRVRSAGECTIDGVL